MLLELPNICIPGRACLVRFVTCLWAQEQQAAKSLPQSFACLQEHFWLGCIESSPLPQLGGRWFELVGAAPFPKRGGGGHSAFEVFLCLYPSPTCPSTALSKHMSLSDRLFSGFF